jgi:MoxR-like ATPase
LEEIAKAFERLDYIAGPEIITAVYLALKLGRPLLVEGPAGVGKTEIAKVLAAARSTRLIRLQCYEGLDVASALYDWNYPKQLLRIQMVAGRPASEIESSIYSEEFLLRRPLLEAITQVDTPVLLIDEIDRADEEFEAYLLELLSDWQVSIPELGTIRAKTVPIVILTSNRVRELSDALRRRCLYLWIDYPSVAQTAAIIRLRAPGMSEQLATQMAKFLASVRGLGLVKAPGVAEALDWAAALTALHRDLLDEPTVRASIGTFLKHQADLERLRGPELLRILKEVQT